MLQKPDQTNLSKEIGGIFSRILRFLLEPWEPGWTFRGPGTWCWVVIRTVLTPAPQPQESTWLGQHTLGAHLGLGKARHQKRCYFTGLKLISLCSVLYIHSPSQWNECGCIPKFRVHTRDWSHGQGRQCHRPFQKSWEKGRRTQWNQSCLPLAWRIEFSVGELVANSGPPSHVPYPVFPHYAERDFTFCALMFKWWCISLNSPEKQDQ